MDTKNKVVGFLGDSITEGVGTTSIENGFVKIIEKKLNLKIALNYGVSGTRIAKQSNPTVDHLMWDYDFNSRARIMDKKLDLVIVFGGTNDFGHGDAEFGSLNDSTEYTFLGALNSLLAYLSKVYGSNKIIFFSPIRRKDEFLPNKYGLNKDHSFKEYIQGIKWACACNNIKFVNMYDIIDERLDDIYINGLADQVHPNDYGNKIISEIMMEEILKL